jgi:hypothetical protein
LKDQRYKAIKSLIQTGSINSLKDIFTIVPISVVKNDLKVNYNTLRRKIDNSELLTVKDIVSLAILFEVDAIEVFKLSLFDYQKSRKVIKKS